MSYLVVALIAGGFAAEPGFSPALTTESGLRTAVDVTIYLGPFLFAVTHGVIADAHAEESRLLGGATIISQRLMNALCTLGLMSLGAVLSLLVVVAYGSVVTAETSSRNLPDVAIGRGLLELILAVFGITGLCLLTMMGRATVAAIGAASGILIVTITVQYSAAFDFGLLFRVVWPPYSAKVVSLAGTNYPPEVSAVAAAFLVMWSAAACWQVGRPPTHARSAPAARKGVLSPGAAAMFAVVTFVTLSSTLPSLSERLPPKLRPSLWVQSLSDTAPDQIAAQFFDALQHGDNETVRTLSAPAARSDIRQLPAFFLRRSPDQEFVLRSSPTIRSAEVEATLAAGRFFVCLVRREDEWLVLDATTHRCRP